MAQLPADRTKLNVAIANQQPSIIASAQANREALTESYDTIDLLNQKVDSFVAGSLLVPFPPAGLGRQAVINGNMDIWQRGTSFTATGSTLYAADRWATMNNISSQASVVSRQDGSGVAGSVYSLRYQRNAGMTGVNPMYVGQSLESSDSRKLIGSKLTLSFWARCGSGASLTSLSASIKSGTGTDQNVITGLTGSADEAAQSFTLTTTWTKFTLTTANVLAASKTQIGILFTTTPSGTAGANDYFEIAQVQVNAGASAIPFQPHSIGDQLDLCQRYYEKSYDMTVNPGTATNVGAFAHRTAATISGTFTIYYSKSKRDIPTLTIYSSVTGATGNVRDITASADVTITNGNRGQRCSTFNVTATAGNNIIVGHYTLDSEIY